MVSPLLPELEKEVVVDIDGTIYLEGLGKLYVIGLTKKELTTLLQ